MGKNEIKPKSIIDYDFKNIVRSTLLFTADSKEIAEFRFGHTERVLNHAIALIDNDMKVDIQKVKIMCWVHDIYKYTNPATHGRSAALMLKNAYVYPSLRKMRENTSKEKKEWKMVFEAIEKHSDKDKIDSKNPYAKILTDADMLDKLTIEWNTQIYELFVKHEGKLLHSTILKNIFKVRSYQGNCKRFNDVRNEMVKKLENELIPYAIMDDRFNVESDLEVSV